MNKKMFFACALAASTMLVEAAGLQFSESRLINLGEKAYHPEISADGSKILFTSEDYKGLKVCDVNTMTVNVLSQEETSGFSPVFTSDGLSVIFRKAQYVGMLRHFSLDCTNLATMESRQVLEPTRGELKVMSGNAGLMPIKTGAGLLNARGKNVVAVADDYDKIVVSENGRERSISPVANANSYLWASLSPKGDKILFVEAYQGVFVCDLNGENLKSYGRGDYPVWVDDEHIVFTKTKDDGYVVTESRLFVAEVATGSMIALTSADQKAEEAAVAREAGKLVYSTAEGRLYEIDFVEK